MGSWWVVLALWISVRLERRVLSDFLGVAGRRRLLSPLTNPAAEVALPIVSATYGYGGLPKLP
ncbi:hypothetical protein THIOKS11140010 [Thiocapsa sp. KS1]|nr:hypothetical protein THIOKS11140010 [Thiocapsa sp. KS1]